MAIELRHLRYFVAVAEELHFHRAAQRLLVAQPALSLSIKRLEQQLGVVLLRRTTRRVELTSAGALFLEKAREAISSFDEATAVGQDLQKGDRGNIVVGGSTQVRQRLSNLLSEFRHAHPNVEIVKREDGTAQLLSDLLDYKIDVGIGVVPEHLDGVSYRTLAQDTLVLAVPSHHRLATKQTVALGELADEVLLVSTDRRARGYNRMLEQRCLAAGFAPRLHECPTYHDEAFQSVLEGAGLELKCWDYVAHLRTPGITIVPFAPEEYVSIEVFWRSDEADAAVHRFVDAAARDARCTVLSDRGSVTSDPRSDQARSRSGQPPRAAR